MTEVAEAICCEREREREKVSGKPRKKQRALSLGVILQFEVFMCCLIWLIHYFILFLDRLIITYHVIN